MSDGLRRLRRRLLTPDPAQATAKARGFHVKDETTRALLESVGRGFQTGFGHAVETADAEATAARLEAVDRAFRGFAYEGAAMGLAVVDALAPLRHDRVRAFISGPARAYAHGAHVGIGWAFARVPWVRWRAIAPSHPVLRWRVLDGYGFHQAYFHTRRYVDEQRRDPRLPWPGRGYPDYAPRVADQGVGRAMWFVGGADVDRVAAMIHRFDPERHSDLFSGAALAATYAGGATEEELKRFRELAGAHRPHAAQGSALAATTRVKADLVTDNTRTAAAVFCGMSPEDVAAATDKALEDLPPDGELPAFEIWRQRIQRTFGEPTAGGR